MKAWNCPKCNNFTTNFKVLKAILKDCAIVSAVRTLISSNTQTNYNALKALVDAKLLALGTPNERVVFIKSDGKYIFDNTLTYDQSKLVENHNTRLEVALAWDWYFGISAPRGVPKFWNCIYTKQGYAISTRASSTVGTLSYYVSKAVSRCEGDIDPESFVGRVSDV